MGVRIGLAAWTVIAPFHLLLLLVAGFSLFSSNSSFGLLSERQRKTAKESSSPPPR